MKSQKNLFYVLLVVVITILVSCAGPKPSMEFETVDVFSGNERDELLDMLDLSDDNGQKPDDSSGKDMPEGESIKGEPDPVLEALFGDVDNVIEEQESQTGETPEGRSEDKIIEGDMQIVNLRSQAAEDSVEVAVKEQSREADTAKKVSISDIPGSGALESAWDDAIGNRDEYFIPKSVPRRLDEIKLYKFDENNLPVDSPEETGEIVWEMSIADSIFKGENRLAMKDSPQLDIMAKEVNSLLAKDPSYVAIYWGYSTKNEDWENQESSLTPVLNVPLGWIRSMIPIWHTLNGYPQIDLERLIPRTPNVATKWRGVKVQVKKSNNVSRQEWLESRKLSLNSDLKKSLGITNDKLDELQKRVVKTEKTAVEPGQLAEILNALNGLKDDIKEMKSMKGVQPAELTNLERRVNKRIDDLEKQIKNSRPVDICLSVLAGSAAGAFDKDVNANLIAPFFFAGRFGINDFFVQVGGGGNPWSKEGYDGHPTRDVLGLATIGWNFWNPGREKLFINRFEKGWSISAQLGGIIGYQFITPENSYVFQVLGPAIGIGVEKHINSWLHLSLTGLATHVEIEDQDEVAFEADKDIGRKEFGYVGLFNLRFGY